MADSLYYAPFSIAHMTRNASKVSAASRDNPNSPTLTLIDESGRSVFVVIELFVLESMVPSPDGAGIPALASFKNVEEANDYASAHVDELERLADYAEIEAGLVDTFKGRYQSTRAPATGPNGEKAWTVHWGHTTMVKVEKCYVYENSASATFVKP